MSDWITDRPPTEADADSDGDVAVKQRPASDGFAYLHWSFVKPGTAWRRTGYWSASEPAAPAPAAPTTQPRRFVSISRTILNADQSILDAIDDDGVVWSMVWPSGCWFRIAPLPARQLPPF